MEIGKEDTCISSESGSLSLSTVGQGLITTGLTTQENQAD